MFQLPKAPLPDNMDEAALQMALDQLNTTFAQFMSAEADMASAEAEGDRARAIRAWSTKCQTAENYMQAWEVLSQHGTILFDEQSGLFRFFAQT